jgi:hypothetical protein
MNDESIFAAALGKSPGAQRRAFLDKACGSDDALRRRIERLLEADRQAGGILERGPDGGPTDAPAPDGLPLLPERVFAGRFKLRQKLGEGGMGEVWVADQAEPVQRRVAIKVVRPGRARSSPGRGRCPASPTCAALIRRSWWRSCAAS